MRKVVGALLVAGLVSTAVLTKTNEASAQLMTTNGDGRPRAFPQGMIGCGLLGAEAVMLIEGAAGLRNRWIMLGTGAIGLAAGAVGGLFLDRALDGGYGGAYAAGAPAPGMTMISTATLIVGLGLVIPTTIVFASVGMYRPPAQTQQNNSRDVIEESTGGAPATQGGSGGGAAPAGGASGPRAQRRMRLERLGMGTTTAALLNFQGSRFGVGMPGVSVMPSLSLREVVQYGQGSVNEVHFPLVAGSF